MTGTVESAANPNRDVEIQFARCVEPSLAEILADPLTRSLMNADRVDANAFETMIEAAADRIRMNQRAAPRNFLSLRRTIKPTPDFPALGYRPSTSRDSKSAAAQSMHGLVAAKTSGTDCGSHCQW
jgi:hypothetical protein